MPQTQDKEPVQVERLTSYSHSPESLSVRVKTKDEASLKDVFLGPTEMHPSGWQKYITSSGKGKSCGETK